jgi:ABC-type glycerol-3-phosphate transport system substrate-binding protein
MKHLKMAIFGILGVCVLYILAFGRKPGADLPKDRVIVRYWEKWTNKEQSQMQGIVDDFNNTVGKEKGIYVQYLSTSAINQKTLVATAAGVPPDVAGLWDAQVPQYAATDALEPLTAMAASKGITEKYYKPVYWSGCSYNGVLYGMVSTPASVALHYNKQLLKEKAPELKAAGLDPNRPPQTIEEFDKYADILDEVKDGRLARSGYLPMEPGWWLAHGQLWWGGNLFDAKNQKFTLDTPQVLEYYKWIEGYSKRLTKKAGSNAITDFRSGVGGFDSPNNPFMTGKLAMVQQGPWMANYIENLKPALNRALPGTKAEKEKFKKEEMSWPIEKRRANYTWGVAPFPSAEKGKTNVGFCPFDVLVIPRGAKNKKEAFEFIAYVNSQPAMEKLNMLHCKNSPLAKVSENFAKKHPNPYIQVFEDLASSPNAGPVPSIPIYPEVVSELDNAAQRVYLLQTTPEVAIREAQNRLQARLDDFNKIQAARLPQ